MGSLYLLLAEVYRSLMGFLSSSTLAVHSFGAIGGYLLGSVLFVDDQNAEANRLQTYRVVGALYYVFFLVLLVTLNVFFV